MRFVIVILVCLPLFVTGCSLGVSEKKDVKMPPGSVSQSAEDVMNTFVKAFKNMDFEAMSALTTGTAKEEFASIGFPLMEDVPVEMREMTEQIFLEYVSRLAVVNSDYVGYEFHFELGAPPPEVPEIQGVEVSIEAPNAIFKMRKENGVWRIYDSEILN